MRGEKIREREKIEPTRYFSWNLRWKDGSLMWGVLTRGRHESAPFMCGFVKHIVNVETAPTFLSLQFKKSKTDQLFGGR